MKHKETKYELPENNQPSMACESPAAAQQYAEDLRYGMEVLNTASPEKLHQIVILLSDYTKEENSLEKQFNALYDSWWNETCIYSGPNLCYDNANFKAIKKMGKAILPYIESKVSSEPQYKLRHLQWLRKGIES